MGLDATTFILEFVNFLVLLWLLSHFLYRPVQAAIAKRQQQADDANKALEAKRAALDAEQNKLQQMHAAFDLEREAARLKLTADIAAERARRLEGLKAELADERAKAQARAAAQQHQDAQRQEALAAQRAQDFVRHYLERLAGPELERAIVRLFLASGSIEIAMSFDPTDDERRNVEARLQAALGERWIAHWKLDPALIAGISVRLDGHLLEASLARGVDAFAPNSKSAV
jgi:F-type H+-transporting ATPase subunit b